MPGLFFSTSSVEDRSESVKMRSSFKMSSAAAVPTQGATSATFEIQSRNTIPSDGIGHKVTVGVINLKPKFEFAAVPKIVNRAYLQAKVVNESDYSLIQGPCAVFLDGGFVAKSSLAKSVSPYESFEMSLGVDPSISIVYSPLKKQTTETGAALLANRSVVQKFTQLISIKNTKQIPITIVVTEQTPMSQDERIKVTLVEPAATSMLMVASLATRDDVGPSKSLTTSTASSAAAAAPAAATAPIVMYQDTHIIDYRLSIPAGESRDIALRYEVSFPEKEKIAGL
eukprot:jgi/Hompol1/2722/HPOL_006147-RA